MTFAQKTFARVTKIFPSRGGNPGLVVMGGDSRSRGGGFKSQHQILDGHFSHYIFVKIVICV